MKTAIKFFLLFLFMFLLLDTALISDVSKTDLIMQSISERIEKYMNIYHHIPKTLKKLPKVNIINHNQIVDAWNNKISYEVNGTIITLISYGKSEEVPTVLNQYKIEYKNNRYKLKYFLDGYSTFPRYKNEK